MLFQPPPGLRTMRRILILTLSLLGAAFPCHAQRAGAVVTSGQRLALRMPLAALVWRSSGVGDRTELFADVVRDADALRVNGTVDRMSAGFGSAGTIVVSAASTDPATGKATILLAETGGWNLRLTYPAKEREFVFTHLFAPSADSMSVRSEVDEALRRRIFSGAMAAVSKGAQETILRILRTTAGLGPVNVIMDAGKPYLAFPAREAAYTCDERDEARRYGAMISEVIPPIVDRVGLPDTTLTAGFGFAVVIAMKTKASTPEFSCVDPGHGAEATMYIPADAARMFAARSISLKELVRRSAVMAGGVLVPTDLRTP